MILGESMDFSEAVQTVISLSEAIQDQREMGLGDLDMAIESIDFAQSEPISEEKELENLLENIPQEFVYKIAFLMYVGRGDFDSGDLVSGFKELKAGLRKDGNSTSIILGKSSLAYYLTEGLAELKTRGIDLNELAPAPAQVNDSASTF